MSRTTIRRKKQRAPSSIDTSLESSLGVRRGAPSPAYTPSTNSKLQGQNGSSKRKEESDSLTWSEEDDAKLLEAIKDHGEGNWSDVAKGVRRVFNAENVQERWEIIKGPPVKGPWTRDEDALLNKLVKRYGPKKWSVIAAHVPGRKGKQCRERWKNHLDTNVSKLPWTPDEDKILLEVQAAVGNRWCEIAKRLPGRPENAVKNRWNSLMNRKWTQSMQKRGGKTRGGNYDDRDAIADLFTNESPFTMATKGRNSFYDKANAIEAPALGASLQLDSPEDRDLLKNLYSALGRSGTAPLLPKTPNVGMGSKNGNGVLKNSPSKWGGDRAPLQKVDSNRIMEMTAGFLRLEMNRKFNYEKSTNRPSKNQTNIITSTTSTSTTRNNNNNNNYRKSNRNNNKYNTSIGNNNMSISQFQMSDTFKFSLDNMMAPDSQMVDTIEWDLSDEPVKMPDAYDENWNGGESLRRSVENMKVSGPQLFRASLG